jgi:hypothetical protein
MVKNVRKSDIIKSGFNAVVEPDELLPKIVPLPPVTSIKRRWRFSFSMALAALGIWIKAEVEREHDVKS